MVNPAQDWPDFTRAMLLVGVDAAGDPVGVLVDGDGNLNAILKGQGAAGLQTIAVDAAGRLEVFVLDNEDQWGSILKIGNAELAARLGSTSVFDWRGHVFYSHDFADGKGAFYCTTSGTGASAVIESDYHMRGGFALKLTGGSDTNKYAKAQGIVGRNPSDRLGFLVAVSSYADSTDIVLRARPVGTRYIGALRYDWGGQKLYYLGDDAGYHSLGTVNCQNFPYVFNSFKLVIDVSTGKYVRALVNDTEFDLSLLDLESDVAGWPGTCEFEIVTYSRVANNDYNYIDHVIVTVDEP